MPFSTGASSIRLRLAPRSTMPSNCDDIRAFELDLVETASLELLGADTRGAVSRCCRQAGGPNLS